MRALTLNEVYLIKILYICRNEVLAREGIDTVICITSHVKNISRNEVLAREGIDT